MPVKKFITSTHLIKGIHLLIWIFIALYFFILPGLIVINQSIAAAKYQKSISPHTVNLHKDLSKNIANWANEKMIRNKTNVVSNYNIEGTEWPIFGAVFYLWSTEALQNEWEKTPSLSQIAPVVYAKDAIDATAKLIADPNQAKWVRDIWGDEYLEKENLFYRMLLLSGLTSHYSLTKDTTYLSIIRFQSNSLAREIANSPHGLLDDYPDECYPSVTAAAVANIQKAFKLLHKNDTTFVNNSIRAFLTVIDSTGLPAYYANSDLGKTGYIARGNSNSFLLTFAPEIYPEIAKQWFNKYEEHFWQEHWGVKGFREFPKSYKAHETYYSDVDAGPVIGGFGCAASAFGISAARSNGRMDLAIPLTQQMYAVSWPLPSGTLVIPALLSNAAHAPFIGEAGIVFSLTRPNFSKEYVIYEGRIPILVVLITLLFLLAGGIILFKEIKKVKYLIKDYRKNGLRKSPLLPYVTYKTLLIVIISLFIFNLPIYGIIALIVMGLVHFEVKNK